MTERLTLDPGSPNIAAIARAADVLRQGGLVAFPTETVYGVGADTLDPQAVARIFAAKGRPSNNPLIVHVADVEQIVHLTKDIPDTFSRLTAAFWPGPLTLVHAEAAERSRYCDGRAVRRLRLRMPTIPSRRHNAVTPVKLPLAAPSANRSAELSPTMR